MQFINHLFYCAMHIAQCAWSFCAKLLPTVKFMCERYGIRIRSCDARWFVRAEWVFLVYARPKIVMMINDIMTINTSVSKEQIQSIVLCALHLCGTWSLLSTHTSAQFENFLIHRGFSIACESPINGTSQRPRTAIVCQNRSENTHANSLISLKIKPVLRV